jgi:AbrB family looped-hinge helix DNA binding protein
VASNEHEDQVGAQGRVVIPAALRKALNLKPGERLVARRVGESLVLERREGGGAAASGAVSAYPQGTSVWLSTDAIISWPVRREDINAPERSSFRGVSVAGTRF